MNDLTKTQFTLDFENPVVSVVVYNHDWDVIIIDDLEVFSRSVYGSCTIRSGDLTVSFEWSIHAESNDYEKSFDFDLQNIAVNFDSLQTNFALVEDDGSYLDNDDFFRDYVADFAWEQSVEPCLPGPLLA